MTEAAIGKEQTITRRSFLKMLGFGVGGAAVTLSGAGPILSRLVSENKGTPVDSGHSEQEMKLLAEGLKFVVTQTPDEPEAYSTVIWRKEDKEWAQMLTFLTINRLEKSGVDWELIKSVVKNTEIAKIRYELNQALPGRIEIAEPNIGNPDMKALPHEWAHEFVWIGKESVNEAFAEYFKTEVIGGRDENSFKFSGCNLSSENRYFNYIYSANSFGRIATFLEAEGKPKLIKVAIDSYQGWMKNENKKRGEFMPLGVLIADLATSYNMETQDIVEIFEGEAPLRCGSLRKEMGLTKII